MMVRIIAFALLLASCTTLKPREGKAVILNTPQSSEQCRVQPWLDWCGGR